MASRSKIGSRKGVLGKGLRVPRLEMIPAL